MSTPEQRASEAVEHVFSCLYPAIQADRSQLGLATEFDFVCLVESSAYEGIEAAKYIESFIAGTDYAWVIPSGLFVTTTRKDLLEALVLLYRRGEHDTSYTDYSRSDSTLLHIHNIRGR